MGAHGNKFSWGCPLKGNTVGSQLDTEKAYIAGFLDGDGSIMMQLKKRGDTVRGYRFMATICLYQDTRHEEPLHWIRNVFNIGYVSRRNDGMSELRINGFKQVREILQSLLPYIRFKRLQANAIIRICTILEATSLRMLSEKQIREIIDLILVIQNENYVTRRKRQKDELLKEFGLTP